MGGGSSEAYSNSQVSGLFLLPFDLSASAAPGPPVDSGMQGRKAEV